MNMFRLDLLSVQDDIIGPACPVFARETDVQSFASWTPFDRLGVLNPYIPLPKASFGAKKSAWSQSVYVVSLCSFHRCLQNCCATSVFPKLLLTFEASDFCAKKSIPIQAWYVTPHLAPLTLLTLTPACCRQWCAQWPIRSDVAAKCLVFVVFHLHFAPSAHTKSEEVGKTHNRVAWDWARSC